jgi:hypothetical protein
MTTVELMRQQLEILMDNSEISDDEFCVTLVLALSDLSKNLGINPAALFITQLPYLADKSYIMKNLDTAFNFKHRSLN